MPFSLNLKNISIIHGQLRHEGLQLGLIGTDGYPAQAAQEQKELSPEVRAYIKSLVDLDFKQLQKKVNSQFAHIIKAEEQDNTLKNLFKTKTESWEFKDIVNNILQMEAKKSVTGSGAGEFKNETRDQEKEKVIERFKRRIKAQLDPVDEDDLLKEKLEATETELWLYNLLKLQDYLLNIRSAAESFNKENEGASFLVAQYSLLTSGLAAFQECYRFVDEVKDLLSNPHQKKEKVSVKVEEKAAPPLERKQEDIDRQITFRDELRNKISALQKSIVSQLTDVASVDRADTDTQARIRFSKLLRTQLESFEQLEDDRHQDRQKQVVLRLFSSLRFAYSKQAATYMLDEYVRAVKIMKNLDAINIRTDSSVDARLQAVDTEFTRFKKGVTSFVARNQQLSTVRNEMRAAVAVTAVAAVVVEPPVVVVAPPPQPSLWQRAKRLFVRGFNAVRNFFVNGWRKLFGSPAAPQAPVTDEKQEEVVKLVESRVVTVEKERDEVADRAITGLRLHSPRKNGDDKVKTHDQESPKGTYKKL